MSDFSLQILINKFLTGRYSQEELQRLTQMLKNDPELLASFIDAHEWEALLNSKLKLAPSVKKRIENKVLKNIQRKPISYGIIRMLVAACMVGIIFSVFYFSKEQSHYLAESVGNKYYFEGNAAKAISFQTITNTLSDIKEIKLPDGSVVLLKSFAQISFRKNFARQRDIFLKGDAYFKVAKNKKHPFTVYENGISIKALGTEFWVCNESNEDVITVKLKEGKVAVKSADPGFAFNEIVLLPGQDFVVNKIAGTALLSDADMPQNNSVQEESTTLAKEKAVVTINENHIIFAYTPIEDVFRIIENMFNINTVVDKEIIGRNQFSGKVYLKDSIANILKRIIEVNTGDFDIDRVKGEKDTYIIKVKTNKEAGVQTGWMKDKDFAFQLLQPGHNTVFAISTTAADGAQINITDDYIEFCYTPLTEVLKEIEQYYNIRIAYAGKEKSNNLFSGKLYHNHSIEAFLLNFCKINEQHYSKTKEGYIIY